ncbi:hypothetical protein AOLI_G00130430 [Acnodon oligacanthus]
MAESCALTPQPTTRRRSVRASTRVRAVAAARGPVIPHPNSGKPRPPALPLADSDSLLCTEQTGSHSTGGKTPLAGESNRDQIVLANRGAGGEIPPANHVAAEGFRLKTGGKRNSFADLTVTDE